MKLSLHIMQGRHNAVHRILVSINDGDQFIAAKTPRDLGGLAKAGFSSIEVANAQEELIAHGTTVLGGVDIDEDYLRHFLTDAA